MGTSQLRRRFTRVILLAGFCTLYALYWWLLVSGTMTSIKVIFLFGPSMAGNGTLLKFLSAECPCPFYPDYALG